MEVDVKVNGTLYNGVTAVLLSLPSGGKARFCEVSDTTAVASDVAKGKKFYDADGNYTAGTATGSGGTADTRKSITVIQKEHQTITVDSVAASLSQTTDTSGNIVYKTEYQSTAVLSLNVDDGYNAGVLTVDGVEKGRSATVPITDGMIVSATDASKIMGNSFDVIFKSAPPQSFGALTAFVTESQDPKSPVIFGIVWDAGSDYPIQIALQNTVGYEDYTAIIATDDGNITTGVVNYYYDDAVGMPVLRIKCDNVAVEDYFLNAINNNKSVKLRIKVTP